MRSPGGEERYEAGGKRLALAAAIIGGVLCTVPSLRLPSPQLALHADWFISLHAVRAHGLIFGRDLEFTYGPLGFVAIPEFHPDTWKSLLIFWVVMGGAGALVLWSHLRSLERRPWIRVALVWLITALGAAEDVRDPWVFALCLVMVLGAFLGTESRPRWQQPLLAGILGIFALTKFSFLIAGAFAVALSAVAGLIRSRRMDASPLIYVLTPVAVWTVAVGNPAGIVGYIRSGLEISSGYSEAMGTSLDAPGRGLGDLLGFLVAAVLLIVTAVRGTPALRLLHAASLALLFFVVWKAAYVRHDFPHAVIGAEFIMLATIAVGAAVRAQTGFVPLRSIAFAAILSLALAGSGWGKPTSELADPRLLVQTPLGNVARTVGHLVRGQQTRHDWAERQRLIRDAVDLSAVTGSFDIYPWGQATAFAWDLEFRPRRTFQSYAAYTPGLLERNAEHLRGRGAPEWLAFDVETIDGRWPAGDDAVSWPELLAWYEVRGRAAEWVILRRRPEPRKVRLEPLAVKSVRLGERVELTGLDSEPLWAAFDLEPTWPGRLANLVFRSSPVLMRVGFAGEASPQVFRIIPAMASEGFVLSPYVDDADSFAALANGDPAAARPLWFEVVEGRPFGLWRRRYDLRLQRLVIGPGRHAS